MMIDYPKTIKEARKCKYGQWVRNHKGSSYQEGRCAYEVWSKEWLGIPCQCKRRNGHGPDGLYCKQHSKMVEGK